MYKKLLVFSGILAFLIVLVILYQLFSPRQLPHATDVSGALVETESIVATFATDNTAIN